MTQCKNGHDASEIHVSPSGKPTCKACARERYQANKVHVGRRYESRRIFEPARVALYRAAWEAGTLDELLMARVLAG